MKTISIILILLFFVSNISYADTLRVPINGAKRVKEVMALPTPSSVRRNIIAAFKRGDIRVIEDLAEVLFKGNGNSNMENGKFEKGDFILVYGYDEEKNVKRVVLSGIIGSINNSMGIKIRVLYRKRGQQMAAERIIRGDDKILIIAKPEEINQVSAIPIMATRQSPVVIKAGSKAGAPSSDSLPHKDMPEFIKDNGLNNEKFARHDIEQALGISDMVGLIHIRFVPKRFKMLKQTGVSSYYAIKEGYVYIDETALKGLNSEGVVREYVSSKVCEFIRIIKSVFAERGYGASRNFGNKIIGDTLPELAGWLRTADAIYDMPAVLARMDKRYSAPIEPIKEHKVGLIERFIGFLKSARSL